MIITKEQAKQKIHNTMGQFFNVTFIKKDGSTRNMNCRLGVKKHLKGGSLPFDPAKYELIPVFCMKKNNYRMINIKTLQELTVNKETFKIS